MIDGLGAACSIGVIIAKERCPKDKPHITKHPMGWKAFYHFRAGYGISPKEALEHLRLTYSRQ